MRKIALAAMAAFTAASAASPVAAATATTNLGVKIVIQSSCAVATPSDLDFGAPGVLVNAVDTTTTLNVTCTQGTTYNVGLGGGASGSVTARTMVNGANVVNYGIFRDAAHTQNWGTTIGTDTVGATGNGTAQPHTVYGRVPAQTTPPNGTYLDTVAVTVTY